MMSWIIINNSNNVEIHKRKIIRNLAVLRHVNFYNTIHTKKEKNVMMFNGKYLMNHEYLVKFCEVNALVLQFLVIDTHF